MVKGNGGNNSKSKDKLNIVDILGRNQLTPTTQGYKRECYDCGLQGSRTEGFIVSEDLNTAFCHSSGKWFKMLEAYALKKGIIRCLDGRDKGDSKTKILGGELFTLTLDEFKSEFGTDMYNRLIGELGIRKSIELPGNNRLMSDFCDELGDIYKSRNVLFFRGELREIVEIHRYKKINDDGKEYVENGFKRVDGNRFITLAEMFINPWTTIFLKTGLTKNVTKSMSQSQSNIALASPNLQNKLPIIARIFDIQIPILHEKKLTFPKRGYDARFGSWLPYNAPQIKEEMFSLEQSKALIDKIFEEFCFASEKDKTHAIAAFITPFLRGIFPKFSTRTPVFIYMANRERAGKDYCAGCSGMLYEGVNVEEPAISNDEKGSSNANEEIRKKIMACMMQGKKRFHSANNKGLLNNSVLEGVTTAEVWSDRVLGRSENVTFNNEMDYSLSGNLGIRLTPDLANRARIINLHLVDEDANARAFKNPRLHEWILENRGAIISALYVLVDNWVKKGMPKGSIPFTSFPHWANVCGGVMEAAGYENPCKSDKSAIISLDNETEEMKLLFETCYMNSENLWLTKGDIQKVVEQEGIMPSLDFNNKADQIKFGLRIDKFINRILSDVIMIVDSLEQRSSRRKYKFTKNTTIFTGVNGIGNLGNDKFEDVCKKNEKVEKPVLNDFRNYKVKDKIEDFDTKIASTINVADGNDGNVDKSHSFSELEKNVKIDVEKHPKSAQNDHFYNVDSLNIGICGNGGKVGNVDTPVGIDIKNNIGGRNITKTTIITKNSEDSGQVGNLGTNLGSEMVTLEDFSKKYHDFIQKENEPQKKEKTDRELQFYESPETAGIVAQCTKEQVLEWIKSNPNLSYVKMYETLGLGCFKHAEDLAAEGSVKVTELGWEVM